MDSHDLACAAVDLQSLGSGTATLLEKPPVKLNLKQDFRVVLLVDATSHLRIPYQISITVEDEKIGNTDNLDFGSTEHRVCQESGLMEDGHFLGDGISRFLHLLVQGGVAGIGESPEGRQMVFLVPESEASQDLVVGTGSDFLFSVVPQPDPQVAACWSVIRSEV